MISARSQSLLRWLLIGEWRAHPVRALVAIAAIAIGVALGYAIHLINAAAYNEFSAAIQSLSGQADLQVRGTQALMDEAVYARVAARREVAVASPVLEVDAGIPGRREALKVIGIDIFSSAAIAPDLVGLPAEDKPYDTLADDAVFLSPAAMTWLGVKQGERLEVRIGTRLVSLRVAGGLVRARAGQRIAVMDIGSAQWRLDRIGRLSRIDLKLATGVNHGAFRETLARELQPAHVISVPQDEEARTANMSRAYRVNLNVLALVALFTGAFLVFSTQALSVIRRRSQLALLRVIGMTRRQMLLQILLEGSSLGVLGSLLGLAGGYLMAAGALRLFGGDLGGGYFPGVQPVARFAPLAAGVFFLLGTAAAVLGCIGPAWEAARAKPAHALKSGAEDTVLARLSTPWPALICIATGTVMTQLPPVFELALFGYLAIALLLIGGIALMPRVASLVFSLLSARTPRTPLAMLSIARLANAPNQASIALAGVLSSFSLMVAMAIMVASFRVSLDDWLSQVLPADLYVRSAASGNTAGLSLAEQDAIAGITGVRQAHFLRQSQLILDPARPSVALIARPIDVSNPGKALPLIGDALTDEATLQGRMPIWISEAIVDLYGYRVGADATLTIAGKPRGFVVAGIWRDYARQAGAIQIRLSDYRVLSGDQQVNDAALWLEAGASAEQISTALRQLPFGDALEASEPGEIRAISLRIFDRSFAVTYLLEAVAVVIGLFGIAATFSAQTLARAKEFGMLRHVGVLRRQILAMLAIEGTLLTLLGIAVGFVLGGAISLILVFVVNPQSFHWTMQLHLPVLLLMTIASLLLISAALTALIAGRYAVSQDAVRAVREDW
ncbi:FtsX-like permease family protein [Noviherbaspirillum saxi]|uniref:ABC transporter permease n=1 Tax=Noviherbaspirillum saxi TaxID=2320863 RepID=A0A3A3FPN1_9BURK|nr:ABC transporter permease [Noviherbaspirillum saxi]RJF98177.1 ABC transporter permease [Noviherbaspirillum saxi]